MLPPALSGSTISIASPKAGRLQIYRAGPETGVPLLLVHTINASGSAHEVRPVYEAAARTRPVFALDLPGFGLSERSDRVYTPRLMTDALLALVDHVQQHHAGPVDVMGVSLGTEYVARAAVERPDAFRSVALVSPTGFTGRGRFDGPAESTRGLPALYRVLAFKPWSDGLYGLLTRPSVIRYFLKRTWGGDAIDEQLFEYDLQTVKAPGAKYAPLHFLAANLFSADISTVYEALRVPVWVTHGVRGDFVDYRGLSRVKDRPEWRVTVYQTGALPYFEQPEQFQADYEGFLAGIPATDSRP
jgi:pimeloyl-ACP methyl ester carboxylesterase